jgi:hypothetical protein
MVGLLARHLFPRPPQVRLLFFSQSRVLISGLQGAHRVHFQDFNAEVLTSLTIPNVAANLAQAKKMPRRVSDANVPTVSRAHNPSVEIKYFAGKRAFLGPALKKLNLLGAAFAAGLDCMFTFGCIAQRQWEIGWGKPLPLKGG